ncbi:MAG: hypothetical protein IJI41_09445 [Anaerolineaceae bacterium]|nr:hypothetical protein [Anaerolineaceae bacterium]
MAEMNGEQLMNEMDTFLNESASVQADAESALPFETITDYLGDPNGFGDVTAKLWKKVTAVFDLAVKYNRHSPDYLKSCAQLEKGIKFLGSSCLQKYALEQKKHVFPELGQLNTANLYTMASIHFNKIDRALTEYMEQKQAVDDALLDMEYRFYHLMERIRATEVKIHNYDNKRYYGQEDYDPVVHGLAFSEKSWTKDQHEHDEPMAFQRARAFSLGAGIQGPGARNQSGTRGQGSGGSEQDPVNEDGRGKNEVVSSGCSSENEGMQREQFSLGARGQGSGASVREFMKEEGTRGQGSAKSEIRNQKSEIEGSVISGQDSVSNGQGSADRGLPTEHTANADPEEIPSEEIPEFVRILERVTLRSRLQNLDYLGFTEEEMTQLLADPGFTRFQPQMAAEMRKALDEVKSKMEKVKSKKEKVKKKKGKRKR